MRQKKGGDWGWIALPVPSSLRGSPYGATIVHDHMTRVWDPCIWYILAPSCPVEDQMAGSEVFCLMECPEGWPFLSGIGKVSFNTNLVWVLHVCLFFLHALLIMCSFSGVNLQYGFILSSVSLLIAPFNYSLNRICSVWSPKFFIMY